MIRVHRLDRLGNLLCQYAFGRLLAERFSYALAATPIPHFPGTRARVLGTQILGPETCWEGQWPRDAYSGRTLEHAELHTPPGARITLRGWFQRFDLIADRRDAVREDWLPLADPLPVRPSTDFLICVRLTDYVRRARRAGRRGEPDAWADSVLQIEEIRHLAKIVPHQRLYFVTDEPGHPLFASLRDLGGEIHASDERSDFRFMHSFQKVAICQSTFHWWATFLGAAREIYFPPLNRGLWSHPKPPEAAWQPGHYGIDLRVDEERYIYDWR